MIIALGIAVFIVISNNGGKLPIPIYYPDLKIGIAIFFLILTILIYFLPKKILNRIDKTKDINEKLMKYRNIYIVKMFLIELLGLSLIIFFFLYGEHIILIAFSVVFLVLISNRPSLKKICKDLLINEIESNILESEV